MTALVVQALGQVELRQVPTPSPGPHEVLLRVSRCGICGTDLGIVTGAFPVPRFPLVIGHECVGTVAAVGGRVSHVELNQLAIVDPILPCGFCHACRRGRSALCHHATELGIHAAGGLAEYVVAPAQNIHPLPPHISSSAGALVEPLACAIHGQDRARVSLGESVAIIGGGVQGLLHAKLAQLRGAARVIMSVRHSARRQRAESACVDLVLDPDAVDPAVAIRKATEGRGADVAIEASGSASGLQSALRALGRGGRLLVHGAVPPRTRVAVAPFEIFERELSLIGSLGGTGDTWPRAIELIAAGRIDPLPLVDAEWDLNEAPVALEELRTNREIVKGMVRVHADGLAPQGR